LRREAGGFDEALGESEDTEFGFRLQHAGMRLSYDPDAVVDHYHPTDLHATLERMDRVGRAVVALTERVRTWPVPPRPGLRHRLRAAALAVANLVLPVRRVREAAWRFLCHEAYRESYWNVKPPDGRLL